MKPTAAVANGRRLAEIMEKDTIDLLVLDLRLPGLPETAHQGYRWGYRRRCASPMSSDSIQ
jgi:hypothetical protein